MMRRIQDAFRARRFLKVSGAFILLMFFVWALVAMDAGALGVQSAAVNFIGSSTDDPEGSVDPGYKLDVAECLSLVSSDDLVEVVVVNGYPSYTCTFTVEIQNSGNLPVTLENLRFDVPSELAVTDLTNNAGIKLEGGEIDIEEFSVHVEQHARQNHVYTFTIEKPFRADESGTIGFWGNWDKHKTYTKTQIETWLGEIDTASQWWGPTTVAGMKTTLNGASSGSQMNKFLGHCLAMRLNERSGRQSPFGLHDISDADPGDYLGLADNANASLANIIARIESKFGTSPTSAQFETMKDVCDGLNNLD